MVRPTGPPLLPVMLALLRPRGVVQDPPKPGGAGVGDCATTGRSPGMKSVLGQRGSGVVEDKAGVGISVGRWRGGVAGAVTWRGGGGIGTSSWHGGSGVGVAAWYRAGGAGATAWRRAGGTRAATVVQLLGSAASWFGARH
jgi:hypothetical protein